MFGSKLARLQRPFIKQSSIPNAINQNLRPKITNYAYHNTMANQNVEKSMNHSIYYLPDSSAYSDMYNYSADGTYQSSTLQHSAIEPSSLKKTKDDILRTMSSISKSGGDVGEQVELLLSLPYELDIRDYTKAIQSCNNVVLLSTIMHELHIRGLVPDLLLYNVYLKKCEDLHDKDEAFRSYQLLLADNVSPDKHTMIILIRCCLQSNSPDEAESVICDAFTRNIEVNSYMYNLLIDYFARRNQPSEAFRLRLQMSQHDIKPDEYTISSLMAACCPQLPSRSQLLILLEDVKSSPLPARSVCASALFSGIAKAPNIENHQKLKIIVSFFNALRSRGYILGQHAYTSLMACCAKLGDIEQAKLFIRDMQASKVEPNQYILTAFISTCSKAKDYESALHVFNYMRSSHDTREEKRRPNKYTYEAMIVAAGNAGYFNDAMQIYNDMLEEGIRADSSTYARLIIVCGLCNNLQQGMRFQEECNYYHIPRTSFFYHALIDLYARCHEFQHAYDILNEVRQSTLIEASHHHYEPIIRALVETNQWDEVDKLLALWNNVSYTSLQYLIINCNKQNDYKRVLKYEGMMRKNGQKPYTALIPIIEHAKQELHGGTSSSLVTPVSPTTPITPITPTEKIAFSALSSISVLSPSLHSSYQQPISYEASTSYQPLAFESSLETSAAAAAYQPSLASASYQPSLASTSAASSFKSPLASTSIASYPSSLATASYQPTLSSTTASYQPTLSSTTTSYQPTLSSTTTSSLSSTSASYQPTLSSTSASYQPTLSSTTTSSLSSTSTSYQPTLSSTTTSHSSSNTMQFLENKIHSIPEFIPMHLRCQQSSLLSPSLMYPSLTSTSKPLISVAERGLFLNDDYEFGGDTNLSLEDLDYDLSADFGFFNDIDSIY